MKFEVKALPDWFERTVKEAKDKDRLLEFLGRLEADRGDSPERLREKARTFLDECGGTAEGVLKCVEEMRQSYPRMTTSLNLPLDQFNAEYAREVKKQSANPVFRLLFPGLDKVRLAQARLDVRRALLSAALAVQLDGRYALQKRRDPVIGGPFEYVAFEGGFELRSKLKGTDGKPVTLSIGRRDK
jgi:hypothetical protein